MENRKHENSNDIIVKLIIVFGAIAAIFVAISLLYRRANKKLAALGEDDAFNFDDEDFLDDCDYCGEYCDCNCDSEDEDEEEEAQF